MPNLSEVARLTVNEKDFEDWKTVWVQHRWRDGWPNFRFSAAEKTPMATRWVDLQFKPGDRCTIELGGELSITGIILTRTTNYDAGTHEVTLTGVGKSWAAATSSIQHPTNNFDKKNLLQIANEVSKPFGVTVDVIGAIDMQPFEKCQIQKGELCFDLIDRLARFRMARIGSTKDGNWVLIGEHSNPIVQNLVEGDNILKIQCVFNKEEVTAVLRVSAQAYGNDKTNMKSAAEIEAYKNSVLADFHRFLDIPAEQPILRQMEAQARANYQQIEQDGTIITAYVTVQGWLRDGKKLWECGDNVHVYSPMAMLNMVMKIQATTFTQDDKGGTLTLLELVLPWKLGDRILGQASPADAFYPAAQDPPSVGPGGIGHR